jgi:hypothetical protein
MPDGVEPDEGAAGQPFSVRPNSPAEHVTWYWPLVWIALVPIVTIPLTAVMTDRIAFGIRGACEVIPSFFGAYANCPGGVILLMLTPGLLNLVPLLWLRSVHRKTRAAATWASSLGALRLLVPAIAVLVSPAGASVSGGFMWTGFPNAGYGPSFELISLGLWLTTFPVIWTVGRGRE